MSNALTSRQRHIKAATAVDLGVLYSTVSAGMLLVRRYLTGRGVDQEFADRYGSAFGRTAAKIYRTSNGAEPRRAWSLVSGKWRRVNGYLPAETDVLDEAYTTYKRTAEYAVTAPVAETPVMEFQAARGAVVTVVAKPGSDGRPYRWSCSAGDAQSPESYASLPFCRDDAKAHAEVCRVPVIPEGCRIPGCDGTWHYDDGICVAQLGEIKFDGNDCALPAELVAPADGPRSIVAFGYDMEALNLRREMRDRASARNFAGQLRALADSIDDASVHLPAAS